MGVLANLRQLEQHLPCQSDARAKYKDVVALLFTDVVVPLQKDESSKEDEHASIVAMPEPSISGTFEPDVPIHAFMQTPTIACTKIKPSLAGDDKEEVYVAQEVDDRADVADLALRRKSEDVIQVARAQRHVPNQAPGVVEPGVGPQVAVDEE